MSVLTPAFVNIVPQFLSTSMISGMIGKFCHGPFGCAPSPEEANNGPGDTIFTGTGALLEWPESCKEIPGVALRSWQAVEKPPISLKMPRRKRLSAIGLFSTTEFRELCLSA